MVTYGPIWSPTVTYGHLWSPIVTYGPVWSHLVPFGPVWSCMVPYGPVWSRMVPYPACLKKDKLPACPKKDKLPTCPEKQVDLVLSHGFHRSPNFRGMYNSSVTMPLSILLKSQLGLQSFLKSSINSQKVVFRCSSESFSLIEVNPLWEKLS